jgi:hypothetical protein
MSINPYTTLYTDNTDERDLNLETATITLLTLHCTEKPIHDIVLVVVIISISRRNVGHTNNKTSAIKAQHP